MKVVTSVAVPDYVYEFYYKVAQDMGGVRTESVMEEALIQYAYLISKDMLQQDKADCDLS